MNIELKEITIQELSDGFQDNNENGVVGFGGKLDIRPKYQREFVWLRWVYCFMATFYW